MKHTKQIHLISRLTVVTLFLLTVIAVQAELPEGYGLASKYPADKGIGEDGRVLFAEDFEQGGLGEVVKRWTESKTRDKTILSLDETQRPFERIGSRSIKITATRGQNTGGHMYKKLKRAVDKAHARFYVRFPEKAQYIHHFVHFGGYNPATNWPQGGAGERPRGDDRITVGIEPFGHSGRLKAPGHWNFYAYWHKMKVSAGGKYWGNSIQPIIPQPAQAGKWQCVEMMIKLNKPGRADGELALWLDGKLVGHFKKGIRTTRWTGMGFKQLKQDDNEGEIFPGFDFRSSDKLKLNFFWLLHYVTDTNDRRNRQNNPPATNPVWFDHIVVAEEYIGPLSIPGK